MRIGVDATCWSNPRGYGRFTKDLLTALLELDHSNEYVFITDSFTASSCEFPGNASKVIVPLSESPTQAASSAGRRSLGDMAKMSLAVSREQLDIFFYPSVYTYYPVFSSARKIVAIHDVIAEQYPELIFRNRRNRLFWNLKTSLAVRQADTILTVSQFSRQGIASHFGVNSDRIRVISEGSNSSFSPVNDEELLNTSLSKYGLTGETRFILYVGGIAPHKNLGVLIQAFSALITKPRFGDIKLVLVGDYENDVFTMDDDIRGEMNSPAFKSNMIFTGYIPDEDLNYLYNAAQVFVLPSFCEGFGLPALEAMSCGTAIIGSNTTSIPEVAGDAGLYFDPNNEAELTQHLQDILADDILRDRLEKQSLERAATFSWQRSAQEMLEILSDLKA